ncbi:uncharacterized protein B0I36DRAFT_352887 [Microdochium trichocladiopsis]|uniref:Uncharacterized protein n=1 Tax=Microdochium trichocladiopsis TaxID=1682393 RepID=A0A9P8XWS4_9PEZI|nr:uncharacterized protein B0I36DRAFT_352887 [Microdochium trichocladiopsis]KAH7024674.1 hypothetical protein B0I36DRAFT_352887 [Microdochium trichocladiopsis]
MVNCAMVLLHTWPSIVNSTLAPVRRRLSRSSGATTGKEASQPYEDEWEPCSEHRRNYHSHNIEVQIMPYNVDRRAKARRSEDHFEMSGAARQLKTASHLSSVPCGPAYELEPYPELTGNALADVEQRAAASGVVENQSKILVHAFTSDNLLHWDAVAG